MGELGGPHGLRGELRLRPAQPGSPSLVPGRRVWLERDGERQPAVVARIAPHGHGMLIALRGVSDRDAAAALTGMRVLVRAADLPALAEDEFYHFALHGFTVVTTGGVPVGTIESTLSTGLNDVWVVRDGAREHLIPIIADVVRAIEHDARRVVIHPMPGLLDLAP